MATLVDELVRTWASRGPAGRWAPELKEFEILVWGENMFLTTSSASEAARRTRQVATVFKRKKLYVNLSSLEILPSRAAERDKIPIVLEDEKEFTWVHTPQVLGCLLDGTGSTEALVGGRLLQGRNMFNKLRTVSVLPADSARWTYWGILHHGRGERFVGLWLLDSIGEGAAVSVHSGKTDDSTAPWVDENKILFSWWTGSVRRSVLLILYSASWVFRPCGTMRWRRYICGRRQCTGATRSGGRS